MARSWELLGRDRRNRDGLDGDARLEDDGLTGICESRDAGPWCQEVLALVESDGAAKELAGCGSAGKSGASLKERKDVSRPARGIEEEEGCAMTSGELSSGVG